MNKILRLSIPFILACLCLGMVIYLARESSQASAAPSEIEEAILVTTLDDELNSDGDCSLREAIQSANENIGEDACPAGDAVLTDTITFDVSGTITLTNQLLVTAGGPLVIDGGNIITISGGGATRVWWVEEGSKMLLRHMIVSDGYISYGGCAGLFNDGNIILSSDTFSNNHSHGDGGGICNSGIMTVTTSVITNNSADSHAGGIYNVSTLHIIDSVISDNHAYSNSGILNWCDVPTCTLSITNSIISDNSSDWGPAGIYNIGTLSIHESTLSGNNGQIGAIANGGIANLTDSTLSGNIAWFGGGGIYNWSTMTVSNSTLSGNSADLINGNGGAIDSYMGNLTVANSTLSGNSAKYGGSIYNNDEYSSIVVVNTIIGTSTSGNECQGTIIDGGHNISSDSSCNLSPVNGSMLNTDPLLGPLQNNNGPTWTQALLEGSPAIDAGDDAQCLPADQRGVPRPQDGDNDDLAICDIGSYEVAGPNIPLNRVYIQGASQGTMNQVYSFTSIVEPFYTTLPLTYTWRADAQLPIFHSEMGLTDIVSYSWEMPGTYAITVTASNLAGSVMDTHMITILHDLYLPLVIKSSEEPIGYNPLLLPTR